VRKQRIGLARLHRGQKGSKLFDERLSASAVKTYPPRGPVVLLEYLEIEDLGGLGGAYGLDQLCRVVHLDVALIGG
jgi:hypothetical protein